MKTFNTLQDERMSDWFKEDPKRFEKFSLTVGDILLDYSKNLITEESIEQLVDLANDSDLKNKMNALFSGEKINFTEERAALHTALRDDKNPDITATLQKMEKFVHKIREEKEITDIINIGIGGSHLGPEMVIQALRDPKSSLRCHFISNVDNTHIDEVLNQLNPDTSLFIISSKTLSTLETLSNIKKIRERFTQKLNFVAVTANPKKALEIGVSEDHIFPFWDFVGGRYSVWSAVGLPVALMIGMDKFLEFLKGANAMDQHFHTAPFKRNMPVILALLGIWYINRFDATTQAIIPYSDRLNLLPMYLQQADMESNGKTVDREGNTLQTATGPILWGAQGINGQHAFYQLLHQGSHLVPIDFILVAEGSNDILVGSALSQAQALMEGKSYDDVLAELMASGMPEEKAKQLAPHKVIPGNKPSNIIFLKALTPFNLGALIALYEHKIFVQGMIWNINPYDQWGVELGKQLLTPILKELTTTTSTTQYDSSTNGLINFYKKNT